MGRDRPIELLLLQTSIVYRTIKMDFFFSSSWAKRAIVSIGDFRLARFAPLSFSHTLFTNKTP